MAVAGTAEVDTLNVAVVAPVATVTLAGTVATAALLLDRVIVMPGEGAARPSVIVPLDGLPPMTAVGFNATEATVTGAAGV